MLFSKLQRQTSTQALARARCAARAQPADEADEPASSGWFDSSHALLDGLTVIEHDELQGDSLALAVESWLH